MTEALTFLKLPNSRRKFFNLPYKSNQDQGLTPNKSFLSIITIPLQLGMYIFPAKPA